jgi:hypothetical protein
MPDAYQHAQGRVVEKRHHPPGKRLGLRLIHRFVHRFLPLLVGPTPALSGGPSRADRPLEGLVEHRFYAFCPSTKRFGSPLARRLSMKR